MQQVSDVLSVDLLSSFCNNRNQEFVGGHIMSLLHIFASNVKKYRQQQNLSQEQLAELSGLHRTYISSIEREQRNISIDNISKIASALKIDPYLLLKKPIELSEEEHVPNETSHIK